jgi:hypothetical protein
LGIHVCFIGPNSLVGADHVAPAFVDDTYPALTLHVDVLQLFVGMK